MRSVYALFYSLGGFDIALETIVNLIFKVEILEYTSSNNRK